MHAEEYWKRTVSYRKPYRISYTISLLLCSAGAFYLFSSIGVMLESIVETMDGSVGGTDLFQKSLLFVLSLAAAAVLTGISMISFTRIEQKTASAMRLEMVNAYLHADESTAEKLDPQDLVTRMSGELGVVARVNGMTMAVNIYQPVLTGIMAVILAFSVDWIIALTVILCSGINMWAMLLFAKKRGTLNGTIAEMKNDILKLDQQVLNGKIEVDQYHLGEPFLAKQKGILNKLRKDIHQLNHYFALRMSLSGLFGVTMQTLLIMTIGYFLSSAGMIRFSKVMLALPLTDLITQMLSALLSFGSVKQEIAPLEERIYSIIDLEPAHTSCCDQMPITFDHVSYSYGDKKVLKDVSFEIKAGEKIAFIGESGAGKTTIAGLILGIYQPDAGEVHTVGFEKIGVMLQDTKLFHDTITGNITLGSEYDAARMKKCAEKACFDEVANQLADGYSHVFPPDKTGLSGGEADRLSLTRMYYHDDEIYLLDEPTSALDETTAHKVMHTLLQSDRTVIVITHRQADLAYFDRIYRVENGHVSIVNDTTEDHV